MFGIKCGKKHKKTECESYFKFHTLLIFRLLCNK